MRKAIPFVAVFIALVLTRPILRGAQDAEFVADELLVQFAPGVLQNQKKGILGPDAAAIERHFDAVGIDLIKLPPGRAVAAAVAALRSRAGILDVQPNYRRYAVATGQPNDPFWLNNSLWGIQTIRAANVWSAFTTGDPGIIVADIDTGVDYNHPDLAANMWRNPGETPGNGIDDDQNGYVDDVFGIDTINHDSDPMDDNSHGTHTAGTIGGVGNNGVGVVGVGWNTKILACKFLNASASGTDAGAVECFNYVIKLKQKGINIRVTSNSWGSERDGGIPTQLKNAIDSAGANGILNVFAAGNAGTNNDSAPFDPASFPSTSIVAVASSDPSDARSGFSNYGATSVDIAAPGSSILSTVPNGGYGGKSGTSMAAPHVAGAAALLLAQDGALSVDALKTLLMSSVDVLPQWTGVVASNGRLNVFTAATAIGMPGTSNVALATNGGVATASSVYSGAHPASAANDGDRRAVSWSNGGWWNDATPNAFPDWLQVQFNGTKAITEVDVYSVQDNYQSPIEPTPAMTFTQYGLTAFDVQYWTGSAWQTVPGGSISGNNLVRRQVTFSPIATDRVRILVNNALNTWSRIPEVEVFGSAAIGSNAPPTVTLTGPADGSTFTAPATVNLTATAGDNDGTVARVDFFSGTTLLFSDFASPYAFSWTNVAAGSYTITAVAVDDDQATTTSAASTITVNPAGGGGGGGTNVALAANGGVASASSVHSSGYAAAGAINGDRRGQPWGSGAGWNDGTANAFPDWLQVQFNGTKTINEVDVFSVQDNYQSPADPTPTMTFTQYGLTSFDVQYWTGTAWQTVPGGAITGNNLVWRKVTFSPIATDRVRVLVNAALNTWSRIAEVEVYTGGGTPNAPPTVTLTGPADGSTFTAPASVDLAATASDTDGTITRVDFFAGATLLFSDFAAPYAFTWTNVAAGSYVLTAVAVDDDLATTTSAASNITVNSGGGGGAVNVALAANGGVASASSVHSSGYAPAGAINGDRRGTPWGFGAGWNDGTPNAFPDWLEVQFSGAKTISEIDVFSVQDSYNAPSTPTPSMTFSLYGLTTFDVQYWTGAAWQTVPGGSIAGNNLVWRQVIFTPVTTDRIRILVHNALDTWSRIAEVEVYGTPAAPMPQARLRLPVGDVHVGRGLGKAGDRAAEITAQIVTVPVQDEGRPTGRPRQVRIRSL